MTDHKVSLVGPQTIIGRSLVIHRYEDDLGRGGYRSSRITGHAGSRLGCCIIERQKTEFIYARCYMYSDTGEPDQDVEGVISLKQSVHGGPTEIVVDLDGFDPDDDDFYHAFHVHERGRLGRRCLNAGGHFNPEGRRHGAPWHADRHVGDLGNIRENEKGEVKMTIIDRRVSLVGANSVIEKSMVVHAREDDMGLGGFPDSKSTGHAGPRLACCIIEESSEAG
ncbi:hypothetical protein NP493_571g00031 [Ridgeia piscesae]|uniref:Superoxide dismutase [Cu-Zn] n=1 Tax=Ridgeia piscesae TaxID=27915 RepID=A0AAD9NRH7_RIDPI|nr:hypothetical protein NP493_571g00031 [Ridgeia piscesae]